MQRRPLEIDLSFESFNDHIYPETSSLSGSTATFPTHQLSLSIEINYYQSPQPSSRLSSFHFSREVNSSQEEDSEESDHFFSDSSFEQSELHGWRGNPEQLI